MEKKEVINFSQNSSESSYNIYRPRTTSYDKKDAGLWRSNFLNQTNLRSLSPDRTDLVRPRKRVKIDKEKKYEERNSDLIDFYDDPNAHIKKLKLNSAVVSKLLKLPNL